MATAKRTNSWVGFDLGGTKMMAAVYDSSFGQLARIRRKTKGHDGEKVGVARIAELIKEAIEAAAVSMDDVGGIGVGCPGPVDSERGVIVEAVNLGWRKVRLKEILEKEFRRPVVVVNDVDAGVYGEYRFGAAKTARCVVGIFPGTGIGAGCVYDGEIVCGRNISCMEIGHIRVVPDGDPCGCGLRGCLETVASRLAISAEAAKAAFRGEAPFLLKNAGTDLAKIRSGILAKSVAAGDKAVEAIIRRAARYLGVGVATVVHLVAPDLVILGGGMIAAMPTLFQEAVAESAATHVMTTYTSSFRVITAMLGDDAAVMGSAAWAEKTFRAVKKAL